MCETRCDCWEGSSADGGESQPFRAQWLLYVTPGLITKSLHFVGTVYVFRKNLSINSHSFPVRQYFS